MAEKRYYWFKFQETFFDDIRIKRLRKIAGGDTYTIIYLKMQLKALKTEGVLYFQNVLEDFYEELALTLEEETDNVKMTVNYLLSVGLLEASPDQRQYLLPELVQNIGSETAGAKRVRDFRKRQEEQALQCNSQSITGATLHQSYNVTKALQCNAKTLQRNKSVTQTLQCNTDVTPVKQNCNGEIDIDIEKEKDINVSKDTFPDLKKSGTQIQEIIPVVMDQWNTLKEYGIQEIKILGPQTRRAKHLNSRIKEFGIESFKAVVDQIKKSAFLQGENDRGWKITFDWVVEPANYVKVLEGNYKTSDTRRVRNFLPDMMTSYDSENIEELEKQLLDN